MLQIENITKRFGSREAVAGLNLHIPVGAVYGLLGPNGAGKTTLIRMIVGLLAPDAGSLTLLGGSPQDLAVRSQVGYMPQDVALYPNLTVAENIAFFGHCYGLDGAALKHRLEELLHLTELTGERNRLVEELSGGTARRVLLATALVHHPKFLVLDEPTAGVDPLLRRKFWQWFRSLAAQGTSILVTTHHIAEAAACEEVIFLRRGHQLDAGTPQELMQRYPSQDLEAAYLAATLTQEGL